MKITIKKESEEVTYQKKTTTHIFKVNDKEVSVYIHSDYDKYGSGDEYSQEVDEADIEKLTDEEHEVFGEQLDEWLSMKDGESKTLDENGDEIITDNKKLIINDKIRCPSCGTQGINKCNC